MLRRSLISLAVLASLAAPAMADGLRTGGIALTNNNASNTNVAAGTGNIANQSVFQSQQGGSGFGKGFGKGSVTNNTAVNTNVAAGFGNQAFQSVEQFQAGR